jgi:hypothetical protein
MIKHRLFNLSVAIALVIVVAFTVREAVATTVIKSQTDPGIECASLPTRYSIRTEYVKEADMWVVRTEKGLAGVDGGLIDLLSKYRTCSR